MQNAKNIFFVASCQRKGRQSASFLRWLGHWCAERSSAHRRCSGIRFAFCEQGDGSSLTRAASKNLRTSANILVFAKRCGVGFAYPRAERVELARKRQAVGIFAQRANILVPRQSRSRIRFAFAALFVGAFCERPRANAVRPYGQTHSARITERSGVTLVP